MYTSFQIVIYLQSVDSSSVTLLNHYDTQKECENIIDQTYKRNFEGGIPVKKLKDDEGKIYLKISTPELQAITYWHCKKAIFFMPKK